MATEGRPSNAKADAAKEAAEAALEAGQYAKALDPYLRTLLFRALALIDQTGKLHEWRLPNGNLYSATQALAYHCLVVAAEPDADIEFGIAQGVFAAIARACALCKSHPAGKSLTDILAEFLLQDVELGNVESIMSAAESQLFNKAGWSEWQREIKQANAKRVNEDRGSWHEYAMSLWAAHAVADPSLSKKVIDSLVAEAITKNNAQVRANGGGAGFGTVTVEAVRKLRARKPELLQRFSQTEGDAKGVASPRGEKTGQR